MVVIREMRAGEERQVADALSEAFVRDAFAIWLMPDPVVRRETMRSLFEGLLTSRGPDVVVDVTDDLEAAAIWLPPGSDITAPPPPSR
jgi:hypothetical protein